MKKISMLVVAIFAMLLSLTVVYAAETTITSDPKKLTITREVHDVTNPVTNTFTYHVEADSSNPAAVTNLPADFNLVMNAVAPDTDNTATGTVDLDMSAVKFTEIGDYKFKVTEIASGNDTLYPVDTKEYYIYVSVRNVTDANNVPTGEIEATLASQAQETPESEIPVKEDMLYESDAEFTYIELSKSVTGDMAKTDKYFAFTINLPGNTGDVYKIVGAHSTDGTNDDDDDESEYVVGTTTTVYLKHGQSITIGKDGTLNQIPIEEDFSITETGAEDYKTYINGSTTNNKATGTVETVATDDANFATTNVYAYVNNKEEATLTGMFLNIIPYIILFVLGIVGVYYIRKTSEEN